MLRAVDTLRSPAQQDPQSSGAKGKHTDGWRVMLRALRHRNYRLFFFGQGISLIGTWMTRVATSCGQRARQREPFALLALIQPLAARGIALPGAPTS
jgi:hypothetical protein